MQDQNIVEWSKDALKQLMRIDRRYVKNIREKVNALVHFPDVVLDIKDLKGAQNANKYRLRVGDYRVIFEVIDGKPKIIHIQAVKKRDDRTYN